MLRICACQSRPVEPRFWFALIGRRTVTRFFSWMTDSSASDQHADSMAGFLSVCSIGMYLRHGLERGRRQKEDCFDWTDVEKRTCTSSNDVERGDQLKNGLHHRVQRMNVSRNPCMSGSHHVLCVVQVVRADGGTVPVATLHGVCIVKINIKCHLQVSDCSET